MTIKIINKGYYYRVQYEVWNDTIKKYCFAWTESYTRLGAYKIIIKAYIRYFLKIDSALYK